MEYATLPPQDDLVLGDAKTNRSVIQIIPLAAGGSDTWNSTALPAGKRFVVRRFGFTDDGSPDGKATTFRLRFGSGATFTDVRLGAVCSGTHELTINRIYVGNGTNFFRVVSTNASAANARNAAFWIEAYDY